MELTAAAVALGTLTGNLSPVAGTIQEQLGVVRERIARCLLQDQAEPLFDSLNSFALTDPFDLSAEQWAELVEICTAVSEEIQGQPDTPLGFRMFRREIPVTAEIDEG